MKKSLVALGLCAVSACVTRTTTTSTIQPGGTLFVADAELYARAKAIHERVFTVDTHVDIPREAIGHASNFVRECFARDSGAGAT